MRLSNRRTMELNRWLPSANKLSRRRHKLLPAAAKSFCGLHSDSVSLLLLIIILLICLKTPDFAIFFNIRFRSFRAVENSQHNCNRPQLVIASEVTARRFLYSQCNKLQTIFGHSNVLLLIILTAS